MKIKIRDMDYERVLALPAPVREKPLRPNLLFRTLLKLASAPELKRVNFRYEKRGMERLKGQEPCLFLMNHSSFIDLKIAASLLYPRPFNIICTSDAFVGKAGLMRRLGCIPTKKFISDPALVRDMLYTLRELKSSILMYPEASYSFDGTATPLPESLGKCLKILDVPVAMILSRGAFARDPLYNGLQLRRVDVSAEMEYLLSAQEIQEMSAQDINRLLQERFSFDNFNWQRENGVRVDEPFRADGLNRVLYKCPHCLEEGRMEGWKTALVCRNCHKSYTLTELGTLEAEAGQAAFSHIPDWYRWERECVRREILEGRYSMEVQVDICMMVDTDAVYRVGDGKLRHSREGFHLTGCEGRLDYSQSPLASYSLYSDYFWYETGDVICIGDSRALYYCFPRCGREVAAKARLATEELYKLARAGRL